MGINAVVPFEDRLTQMETVVNAEDGSLSLVYQDGTWYMEYYEDRRDEEPVVEFESTDLVEVVDSMEAWFKEQE